MGNCNGLRGGSLICKPLDYPLAFALVASTYGWTHQEILALTAKQFFLYLRQVGKLSSMKQLKDFEASLMPHMEKSDRVDLFRRYQEVLVPVKVDKKEVEDAWDFLRAKKRGS